MNDEAIGSIRLAQPVGTAQANERGIDGIRPGGGSGSTWRQVQQTVCHSSACRISAGACFVYVDDAIFPTRGVVCGRRSVLAVTLWIAAWWITEAIPIPATSLLPLILLPVTGAMQGNVVASSYGNDIIFLFLGGFLSPPRWKSGICTKEWHCRLSR